jgi:hypothetical protein
MKMAHNWAHEYPTGTPLLFIRDDIIACWERNGKVTRKDAETASSTSKKPVHNYVKEGLPKLHGK